MYTDDERLNLLEKFLELRSKGLSGTAAAVRVGVSYKALRRWENGDAGTRLAVRRAKEAEAIARHYESMHAPLRADNQQDLPLDGKQPAYSFPGVMRLTTLSGLVVHGTPEELAKFAELMER